MSIVFVKNRTFVDGGTEPDKIKNIYGSFKKPNAGGNGLLLANDNSLVTTGAFSADFASQIYSDGAVTGNFVLGINLDASKIVPVGPENSPRTSTERIYRRVS